VTVTRAASEGLTAPRAVALLASLVLGALVLFVLWPEPRLPESAKADRVIVLKGQRRLLLLHGGETLKAYTVALGPAPQGHKSREGDGRTPEGTYRLDARNPRSRFHRALHISYPNESDRARAVAAGASPGGDIMIHGLPNGLGWIGKLHRFVDWTDGCIAVTNREMEEIWRAVDDGTPIEIRP
jgi:murein L,D-transpeptidase YafK